MAFRLLPSTFASRSSAFFSAWFPVLHFQLPVLSFPVCFLSPFPDSLPQLFLRCLLSHFQFPFRFLSSSSVPLPATQLDCSSFPPSSRLCLTAAFPVRFGSFRHLCFSPSVLSGFPFISSGSAYLAFCWFPFVLPCFAPAAVPQVIPFWISPPGPAHDFHILSSASILASHYSAFVSSFPLFPFSPHNGLSGALRFLSSPSLSPFRSACFHASLPVSVLSSPAIPFSDPCFASQVLLQVPTFAFRL